MTTKAGERCPACERGDRTTHAQHMREAEAVRDALTDLRAAVDGLPASLAPERYGWGPLAGAIDRAAVLDEIEKRMPGGAAWSNGLTLCNCPTWGGQTHHNDGCLVGMPGGAE